MITQQYINTNHPDYVRDIHSKTIINTNESYYNQILASREQARKTKEVTDNMKKLEDELSEIKNLLSQYLIGKTDV